MEKTTIEVSKKLRAKLTKLKYKLSVRKIEDVIQRMYDIITKFKLGEELDKGK